MPVSCSHRPWVSAGCALSSTGPVQRPFPAPLSPPRGLSPPDVDECAAGLAQCAHGCLNTQGSFKCACHAGYELGADGRQCYREWAAGNRLKVPGMAMPLPRTPQPALVEEQRASLSIRGSPAYEPLVGRGSREGRESQT